jgi:Peptidase M15/Type IV secretion system pilin
MFGTRSMVEALGLVLVLLLAPMEVGAAALADFAGCSGLDCSACNLVSLANGVIVWLIGFTFLIFMVVAVAAGFGLVTSGGNRSALDEAKNKFTSAFVGLIIILSAWLIVDTVMRGLVGGAGHEGEVALSVVDGEVTGWLFWSEVQCYSQVEPADYEEWIDKYPDGTLLSEAGIPGPDVNQQNNNNPAIITGNLVSYTGAQFDSGIIENVRYVATTFGLRVSGGYRTPERNREVGGVANSNHLTGRAADFVGTSAQMEQARQWAINNGAREALIHNVGSGIHLHLAW